MVGTSWMVAGRTGIATLVGFLVIAINLILWWALIALVHIGLSDCGWAIGCSMTTANVVLAAAISVLLVAPFAWIVFRTVRGLGRWVSADDQNRSASRAATTVTAVLVAAAFALLVYGNFVM